MKKVIIGILSVLLLPSVAQAQTHFSINPAVVEISEGETTAKITISNSSTESLLLTYRNVYLSHENSRIIQPLLSNTSDAGITLEGETNSETIELNPGENKQIDLSIANNSEPTLLRGIMFTSVPPEAPVDKTIISLSGAIIVPLIEIGHTSTQALTISRLNAPFFTSTGDLKTSLEVNNHGYTSTVAEGAYTIKNLLGQEIVNESIKRSVILPNEKKVLFSHTWDPKLLIGIYSVNYTVHYGDKYLERSKTVIGIPASYTIILLLGSILATGIYLRVKKYHR
jgi:hypothetical protein